MKHRWWAGTTPTSRGAKVALSYSVIATLWIFFSDALLLRLIQDALLLTQLQTVKGGLFVVVTALVLFVIVRHSHTSLQLTHAEVSRAARDELTGLAGWHHLRQLLGQLLTLARQRNEPMAIIVLGIGQLRRINEVFGVATGDALIMQLAQRLRDRQQSNLLLARPGGGYFVVLVTPPCDPQKATAIARELVFALNEPVEAAGERLQVTANAGVAVFPRDGHHGDTLLRTAEIAMVDARTSSEAVTSFRKRTAELRARFSLENDLRGALKRGEFRLFFQPLVSLADGEIVGAEALLRWQHPESGLISPATFIPLLEKSGDIVAVGNWVFTEAARWAGEWPDAQLRGLKVSINVSRLQLAQPDFVDSVRQNLQDSGFDPARVVLEITESLAMRDPAETMTRMAELREVGVGLAMDDFGTGYSSLAYLKRYPLNFLKVDRLFVQGIPQDHENDLLMETIMDMSRRLNLLTVAEGIETEDELHRLVDIGYGTGQGFLFSPPIPAEQFHALLASGRPFPVGQTLRI